MSFPGVITPHRAKRERRATLAALRSLRIELAEIRRLRASALFLDREGAEGRLEAAWHEHNRIRRQLRWLRTVRIEKGSAWSPAACMRRGIA